MMARNTQGQVATCPDKKTCRKCRSESDDGGSPGEAGPDPERTYRLAQEVKRLTLPAEMGERFKILAVARGVDAHGLPWWGIDQGDRL